MSPCAQGVLDGRAEGVAYVAAKARAKADVISARVRGSDLSTIGRAQGIGAAVALLDLANELDAEARGEKPLQAKDIASALRVFADEIDPPKMTQQQEGEKK